MKMLKTVLATTILAGVALPAQAGEVRPWGPDIAFEGGWVFPPAFSPDGGTAWVVHWADPINLDRPQRLYRLERNAGSWSAPVAVDIAPGQLLDWPAVSPDGERLVVSIATARQINGQRIDDFDLYGIALPWDGTPPALLEGDSINLPKTPANATIGYAANETGPLLLDDGTLVFWTQRDGATGWRDIFFAAPAGDGRWAMPVEFPHNTPQRDSHPFLPPDGSWMIFASNRPGGYGEDDLYYTERQDDGSWSPPCNLGAAVNSSANDNAMRQDPATGSFLFSSDRETGGRTDYRIYEVDLEGGFCE